MEEFDKVKTTMSQNLINAVGNIAIANATERQQILDKYNAIQTQTVAFENNKGVTDDTRSQAA